MPQHEHTPTAAEKAILEVYERVVDSVQVARIAGNENATTSADDLINVATFAMWATKTLADVSNLAVAIRGTEYSAIGVEIMRLLQRDDPFEDDASSL